MCGCVLSLYLGDSVAKPFVLWARDCELTINLERELFVALLQIELRHRLVDERLRAGAAECSLFRARRLGCAGRWLGCACGRFRRASNWLGW
jgi:hypothetical protein